MLEKCVANIRYKPAKQIRNTDKKISITTIGIDTEALTTGECFMACTSLGDVYDMTNFPDCFFTRKYRNSVFVAYNLKYDSGAFVQHIPLDKLKQLQLDGTTEHDGFRYKSIGYKCLSISRGKNAIHMYDMLNFYNTSLNVASKKYLGKQKLDIDTYEFTPEYVKENWDMLADYCIQDAKLVQELSQILIERFEGFGVYPRKLYSVAYIAWQYFSKNAPWIHVKGLWQQNKRILDYAMQSYNGGKFEVTTKGIDYYYEYDIVSQYPNEIRNLVDLRKAKILRSRDYQKESIYAFINCTMRIPISVHSPLAMKNGNLNYYPRGIIKKIITKTEYDYLTSQGCDSVIHDAYWFLIDDISYPYRTVIDNLMKYKDEYKRTGDKLNYHTVKILMNSFYGKLCQLIDKKDYWQAGSSWNPIYASVITANARVSITKMQQDFSCVVAVHTDSIITTQELGFPKVGSIGDMIKEVEGKGIILGSGIYQIGDKTKFRGFTTKEKLLDLLPEYGNKLYIDKKKPITWKEAAHRGLSNDMINRFIDIKKALDLNFDRKRMWVDDYVSFEEVRERPVFSAPFILGEHDY